MIRFTVPIKTVSTLNRREHWAAKANRARAQVTAAWAYAVQAGAAAYGDGPITVRMTRHGPRTMDGDNLQGALKSVRDGIAKALGRDDGDRAIRWEYDQCKGKYAVAVEISRRG